MESVSDKWKHFERLVTAVHRAADQGAEVAWNESIAGRQFDVTIRFRRGLYQYLTVVECKEYQNPVPVEKVEAFVTKAADAQAHHAVMASTSGFQAGARKVASKHNMSLIHVTDSSEIDLSLFGAHWTGIADALHIDSIELEYADKKKKRLPDEANAMTYYVQHIVIQYGSEQATLADLIGPHLPHFGGGPDNMYKNHVINCTFGMHVVGPDDGEIPLEPLTSVHVRAGMIKARTLTSPAAFDISLLSPDVKIKNVATGEEQTFSVHGLPLGIDTVFTEGAFYEQPPLAGHYYYCDRIDGDVVTIYLVESFQVGQLIQCKYTAKAEMAKFYIPVSDKAVIQRLQRRLNQLKQTA
jgi:hypothetical protein